MYLQPMSLSLDLEQTSTHHSVLPSEVADETAGWLKGLVSLDKRLHKRTGTVTGLWESMPFIPSLSSCLLTSLPSSF